MSAPPTENEKDLLVSSIGHAQEAKRRLWTARDEVDRARAALTNAELRLKQAQREADESATLTRNYWDYFRECVLAIPIIDERAAS